jgi:hypothetical protein
MSAAVALRRGKSDVGAMRLAMFFNLKTAERGLLKAAKYKVRPEEGSI